MSGLDGDDFGGNGKNSRSLDEGSGCEVGGDTNVLEDAGSGNHGLGGGETEVVCARLNWLSSCTRDGCGKGCDVGCFCATNGLEVSDVCRLETEGGEVRVGKLGETLLVECCLEVF
jgi:hypothetical protein